MCAGRDLASRSACRPLSPAASVSSGAARALPSPAGGEEGAERDERPHDALLLFFFFRGGLTTAHGPYITHTHTHTRRQNRRQLVIGVTGGCQTISPWARYKSQERASPSARHKHRHHAALDGPSTMLASAQWGDAGPSARARAV